MTIKINPEQEELLKRFITKERSARHQLLNDNYTASLKSTIRNELIQLDDLLDQIRSNL